MTLHGKLPPVPASMGLARREVMTQGEARRAAAEVLGQLADVCERIEIAGSIRRQTDLSKDVEIVALGMEYRDRDLFGEEYGRVVNLLEKRMEALLEAGLIAKRRSGPRSGTHWGPFSKRIAWWVGGNLGWVPVDLFVPRSPLCWGGVLALRTGPGGFSQQLVVNVGTQFTHKGETRERWGLKPLNCEWKDGWLRRYVREGDALVATPRIVPLPEESELFRAFGLPWLAPEHRA